MRAEDVALGEWAAERTRVDGVEAVMLGGSRARGTHGPASEIDLGPYHRAPLDTTRLRTLAAAWCATPIDVTEPGGWARPWVDRGAWLVVDGIHVDWIYRDLARVEAVWSDCSAGRVNVHHQIGHPMGFVDAAYAGEVALERLLSDRTGRLTAQQQAAAVYPSALREAIRTWLWEADLDIEIATKAVQRRNTTYVAGRLFRTVLVCAHVLCAEAGSCVLNENSAVASAAALPNSPPGFGDRAHALLAAPGTTAASLRHALGDARALVRDTQNAVAR